MYILWSIFVVILIILYCIYRKRYRTAFWKLVKHDPSRYYKIFKENPQAWIVGNKDPSDYRKTNWPFDLYVPELGKKIPIYGVIGKYQKHRKKLLREAEKEWRDEE